MRHSEWGGVVSALSVLIITWLHGWLDIVILYTSNSNSTYGLNSVSPELNFIHHRAGLHSLPSWKSLTTELKVDRIPAYLKSINNPIIQRNRGLVYLEQSLCLFRIESLFGINTGSVEPEIANIRINYASGWKGWNHPSPLRMPSHKGTKLCLQPLSPSIKAFANEAVRAECEVSVLC